MPRYIFLRIAWMKHYQGATNDDIPVGAGSYITENADGGEVYNFYPIRGSYYGYARIQMNKSLRLERLGAKRTDDRLKEITIVFFAKNPTTGGQYVVGWYKNAILFKNLKVLSANQRHNHSEYLALTDVTNGYLVPEDDRLFEVPDNGPGQSNAWYVEEYQNAQFLKNVAKYVHDPENYIFRKPVSSGGWQVDIQLRQKIEFAAMDEVANYFEKRNYAVKYKHKENLGWDLEATLGKQTLLLEVKGLSGDLDCIDLTPNEFENCNKNRKHYRICIVSNVLKKDRKLDIFFTENGHWVNRNGEKIIPKIRQSARFTYQP